jgi:hypothetical protein
MKPEPPEYQADLLTTRSRFQLFSGEESIPDVHEVIYLIHCFITSLNGECRTRFFT